ncbi:hypothetical protein D3C81_1604410 [compost metagenome]
MLLSLNVEVRSVILSTTVAVFVVLSQVIVVFGSSDIVFTGTNITPFLSTGGISVFTTLLFTKIEGVFAANTLVNGIMLKNAAKAPNKISLFFIV